MSPANRSAERRAADAPVNILIIHASKLFASGIRRALQCEPALQVADCPAEPEALRLSVLRTHPAVLLFDLALPTEKLRRLVRLLREHYPVPMLACVAPGQAHASRGIEALALGITEIALSPTAGADAGRDLATHIRVAAGRARSMLVRDTARVAPKRGDSFAAAGVHPARHLIVIGASTGGPETLRLLLASMPADAPPIVIVQHMPAFFTKSFATRLDQLAPVRVWEAAGDETIGVGDAVVARGDTHLIVERVGGSWRVRYTHQRKVNRHCPSVDVLFESAVRAAGAAAVGILLTGMGDDGARGLLNLRRVGALTFAQSNETCTVYGMPKAAIDLGAAMSIAAPEDIPGLLVRGLADRARLQHTRSRFVSS